MHGQIFVSTGLVQYEYLSLVIICCNVLRAAKVEAGQ
jgi:hypothetical protein